MKSWDKVRTIVRNTNSLGDTTTSKIFDFGEIISSGFITISAVCGHNSSSITANFTFEVSEDNSTWTTVLTGTGELNTQYYYINETYVGKINNIRYVKISYSASTRPLRGTSLAATIWY